MVHDELSPLPLGPGLRELQQQCLARAVTGWWQWQCLMMMVEQIPAPVGSAPLEVAGLPPQMVRSYPSQSVSLSVVMAAVPPNHSEADLACLLAMMVRWRGGLGQTTVT